MGRPCWGLLSAFTARQYYEQAKGWALTPTLRRAGSYLDITLGELPDRVVRVLQEEEHPKVLYTDCAAHGRQLRVGLLLFCPGAHPVCFSADVPDAVANSWEFRKPYFQQGELLAGPLAAWLFEGCLGAQVAVVVHR